jgi:hypothetical protein
VYEDNEKGEMRDETGCYPEKESNKLDNKDVANKERDKEKKPDSKAVMNDSEIKEEKKVDSEIKGNETRNKRKT